MQQLPKWPPRLQCRLPWAHPPLSCPSEPQRLHITHRIKPELLGGAQGPPVLPLHPLQTRLSQCPTTFCFSNHLLTSHPLSPLKEESSPHLYIFVFPGPSKALGQSALPSYSGKSGKPSTPKPHLSFTCSPSFPAARHDPTAEPFFSCVERWQMRESPGSPVVRTRCFHCQVPGSIPGWGTIDARKTCCVAKKKKKKRWQMNMHINFCSLPNPNPMETADLGFC